MAAPSQSKWTAEQREAIASASDDGMSAREVAELATAGELVYRGEPLPTFELSAEQVKGIADRERKRSGRDLSTRLAALLTRQIDFAEREMKALEKAPPGKGDTRRFQQLAMSMERLIGSEKAIAKPAATTASRPAPEGGSLLQAMRAQTPEPPIVRDPEVPPPYEPEPEPEPEVDPEPTPGISPRTRVRDQVRRELEKLDGHDRHGPKAA